MSQPHLEWTTRCLHACHSTIDLAEQINEALALRPPTLMWLDEAGARGIWFEAGELMTRIIGVSGSLRRGSYNTSLLRAAASLAPEGSTIDIGSIRDFPVYNADVEAEGTPAPVRALKDSIASSDGLLIVTPEYNNSIPGGLKNAIDWLSSPTADVRRVFEGRPVAIIGASRGPGGTALAQAAWLPVLRTLGTLPWFGGRLMVPHAAKVFDEQGRLIDEAILLRLEKLVRGFVEFAAQMSRAKQT